jgi:hypothetical protein
MSQRRPRLTTLNASEATHLESARPHQTARPRRRVTHPTTHAPLPFRDRAACSYSPKTITRNSLPDPLSAIALLFPCAASFYERYDIFPLHSLSSRSSSVSQTVSPWPHRQRHRSSSWRINIHLSQRGSSCFWNGREAVWWERIGRTSWRIYRAAGLERAMARSHQAPGHEFPARTHYYHLTPGATRGAECEAE